RFLLRRTAAAGRTHAAAQPGRDGRPAPAAGARLEDIHELPDLGAQRAVTAPRRPQRVDVAALREAVEDAEEHPREPRFGLALEARVGVVRERAPERETPLVVGVDEALHLPERLRFAVVDLGPAEPGRAAKERPGARLGVEVRKLELVRIEEGAEASVLAGVAHGLHELLVVGAEAP